MELDDLLGALIPKPGPEESKPDDEQESETSDLLKKLLENDDGQIASSLSGLLGNLQPPEGQTSPDESRANQPGDAGLNIAGLLKMPGIKDVLIKLLAEKLNLPNSTLESVLEGLGIEKKKTRRKTSGTTTRKRKSASSRRTTSSGTAKKKSSPSTKKTTTRRSTSTRKTSSSTAKAKTRKPAAKKSKTTTRKRSSTTRRSDRSEEIDIGS